MRWIRGIFLKTKIYFTAQTAEYLKKNINQLFLQKNTYIVMGHCPNKGWYDKSWYSCSHVGDAH